MAYPATHQAAQRPNVVVILADDQGWGDLSLHGNTNLSTPHLDSLAKDGASFDRFYVCPVCAPTRAEFLTGRYHPRSGVYGVSAGGERMNTDETTIADTFKAAGYATAAFGKWHNGTQYPYHPNGRGFAEYYGFCSGHWGNYFSPLLEHNGQFMRGNGYVTNDFTDRAIKFIEDHCKQPFFVYLPFNTPHSPMQVPDRWWNRFKDKSLEMRHRYSDQENVLHTRAALAMCENIDWNVGRLLRALDELKLADNTIVVYFSDNGPNGYRWNGDMRGRKGSTDEGGVRSPLFLRWPGVIQANHKVLPIAAAIDLLPTLADLAGVEIASQKPPDGVSLRPLLLGEAGINAWEERQIFSHWGGRVSVRTPDFRLDHQGRLYDMKRDPGQRHDASEKYVEVAKQLKHAVVNWKTELLGNLGQEKRPFLIGHADSCCTQLPARDAAAHGNIQRSNKHPNCSFFSNWRSTTDKITWDVEVVEAGTYEVEIYYTCSSSDVGSTIELSFHGNKLAGTVAEAHDPPLRGKQDDRMPRRESYVKDFKPMKLGTIELAAGPGQLTLQASTIAGSNVMDFRLLMLTRVHGRP